MKPIDTSKARVREIVEVARALLASEGLGGFSLRKVADGVGIKLASLQFHVPTKADLIRIVADDALDRYNRAHKILLSKQSASESNDPEVALKSAVNFYLRMDTVEWQSVKRFEVQFWALAYTDEAVGRILDQYMRIYREALARLILAINPKLTQTEAVERGALLSVMIDGSRILQAPGIKPDPELEHYETSLGYAAVVLAKAAPRPE